MSNDTTSTVTQYAATVDPQFAFSAKHGGSIEVVGGSEKAKSGASQIISSLTNMSSVARESSLGAAVAGAASLAALGTLDPTLLFVGAAGGAVASLSKGSKGRV